MKKLALSNNEIVSVQMAGCTGLVVYKTSSQMGTDHVFDDKKEYIGYAKGTKEAHKILEVDRIDGIEGLDVCVTQGQFGNRQVAIGDFEYTIPELFQKFGY